MPPAFWLHLINYHQLCLYTPWQFATPCAAALSAQVGLLGIDNGGKSAAAKEAVNMSLARVAAAPESRQPTAAAKVATAVDALLQLVCYMPSTAFVAIASFVVHKHTCKRQD